MLNVGIILQSGHIFIGTGAEYSPCISGLQLESDV
jgi:hypothetical protein